MVENNSKQTRTKFNLGWFGTFHNLLFIMLTLISLLSVKYLLKPGFHYGHDSLWHVQRITAMFQELKKGKFPVRWVAELDNQYGIPLFNYVYPGPYYLAAGLMFLGLGNVAAFNLINVFFYVLGGWGVYFLFRKRPWIGLVVGLMYLFTPYQFVNLFVRGALGEVVVMGLAPWVFVALEDLRHKDQLKWYHPLPLALALISHNFLGLILFALACLYSLLLRFPLTVYLSLLTSLALAAFFLIPMFFERSYLLSSVEQNFSFRYSDHFVEPGQLLYSKWDYWFSMPGTDKDGMTFQLGLANIIIFLISILILLFHKRLAVSGERLTKLKFFIFHFSFFIFLMLPQSIFIWRSLPLMQAMQFPWRLLAFTTILSAIMGGVVLKILDDDHHWLAVGVGVMLVCLALINTRNYHRSMRTLTQDEFQELHRLYANKTTTSARSELVPKWSKEERWNPTDPELLGQRLARKEGGVRLKNLEESPEKTSFIAIAENDQTQLKLYRNYFPSWQATVDGKRLKLKPSESGEIVIPLKQGEHNYVVWVGETRLERLANGLSLAALLMIVYLSVGRYCKERVKDAKNKAKD